MEYDLRRIIEKYSSWLLHATREYNLFKVGTITLERYLYRVPAYMRLINKTNDNIELLSEEGVDIKTNPFQCQLLCISFTPHYKYLFWWPSNGVRYVYDLFCMNTPGKLNQLEFITKACDFVKYNGSNFSSKYKLK